MQSSTRLRSSTLDRPLQKTKGDVNYLNIYFDLNEIEEILQLSETFSIHLYVDVIFV